MTRTYEYHGYTIAIAVESDSSWPDARRTAMSVGYVAIVRIFQGGKAMAVFSPLRLGEVGGHPFATEADALTGGYSAALRIVDDLFNQESQ